MLGSVTLSTGDDHSVWLPSTDGAFYVRSASTTTTNYFLGRLDVPQKDLWVWGEHWKRYAPWKVLAFSWSLLLVESWLGPTSFVVESSTQWRLPCCVFCQIAVSQSSICLLVVEVLVHVWYEVFRCLGFLTVVTDDIPNDRKAPTLIWHTLTWLIWELGNSCVFSNSVLDYDLNYWRR